MEQSLNFSFSKSADMSSKLRDHVKEADVVVHAHNPQTRVTDILAIQTRQISKHLPMSEWYQKTRLVTEELHSRLLQLFYVMLYLTDIPSRPGLTFFFNFFWRDIKEKRIWERGDYGVDWEEWRKGTMQSGYNVWEKSRRKIKDLPLPFGNWNFNSQASNNYEK